MTRKRSTATAASMLTDLAMVSPGIVASRLLTAAAPGRLPNATQQRELQRMVQEKTLAFGSGLFSMHMNAMLAWQSAWTQAWLRPGAPTAWPDAMSLWADGLRSIHRTAIANAKRLGTGAAPRPATKKRKRPR